MGRDDDAGGGRDHFQEGQQAPSERAPSSEQDIARGLDEAVEDLQRSRGPATEHGGGASGPGGKS
jgi:hypothetical protein